MEGSAAIVDRELSAPVAPPVGMEPEILVAVWKWRGWRGPAAYTALHVNTFARMLRAHMTMPYRLVCITDDPKGITECETDTLWNEPNIPERMNRPNCFRRLRMFSEWARERYGQSVLSVDLDCVIFGDLAPLIRSGRGNGFAAMRGIRTIANGSLMYFEPGTEYQWVWDSFDPKTSPAAALKFQSVKGRQPIGSDQAWISKCIPRPKTWGTAAGLWRIREWNRAKPSGTRVVFSHHLWKPWHKEAKLLAPAAYDEWWSYADENSPDPVGLLGMVKMRALQSFSGPEGMVRRGQFFFAHEHRAQILESRKLASKVANLKTVEGVPDTKDAGADRSNRGQPYQPPGHKSEPWVKLGGVHGASQTQTLVGREAGDERPPPATPEPVPVAGRKRGRPRKPSPTMEPGEFVSCCAGRETLEIDGKRMHVDDDAATECQGAGCDAPPAGPVSAPMDTGSEQTGDDEDVF